MQLHGTLQILDHFDNTPSEKVGTTYCRLVRTTKATPKPAAATKMALEAIQFVQAETGYPVVFKA
jgi:hypothetical protein